MKYRVSVLLLLFVTACSLSALGAVSVTLTPPSAQVFVGHQQQFTATVRGSLNLAVTFSLSGSGCSGAACGTISNTGLYTAPATAPNPPQVAVTATSSADPTQSASSTVTVLPPVSISVSPISAQVLAGQTQQFTATVTGNANTSVTWTVAGSGCTGSACGTVSTSGLYTAPTTIPNPPQVTVTATSVADPTKSASASVTILSPVVITISPLAAQVIVGQQQPFTATVTGTTNHNVTWTVTGSGCAGSSCGTVSSSGLYTAPANVPNPPQVTVTATSVADTNKTASATVTVLAHPTVSVSPTTAQVFAGEQQQFTATVTGNSNTAVTWSLSGTGCTGAACGTITNSGLYTAPTTLPNPPTVTVKATSVADTTRSATATVTILPAISVTISPTSADVFVGLQQPFTVTVTGSANHNVTWTVSGAGCTGAACGTVSSSGLYTAPATRPNPPQVTVTVTSVADTSKSDSATVTIEGPVSISISPTKATVILGAQQQFTATISGNDNTQVSWSVSGAGCSGSDCGTLTNSGLYTAPAKLPNPPQVLVTAVSVVDPTKSASATVTLLSGYDAKFSGQYAFHFDGFDSNGVYRAVGTITADGSGHILSGSMDVNTVAGPQSNLPVTGTYDISGDNRGVLKLSSALGNQTFRLALNQQGNAAQFIAFESSGLRGSGALKAQDASAFSASALHGFYVLSLTGSDSAGGRIGAVGQLLLNNGTVLTGTLDVNDSGTVSPTFGAIAGTYSVSNTGRGNLTLFIPGFDGEHFKFTFYVVSANELFNLSSNQLSADHPLFGGPVESQSGLPFDSSEFNATTIFNLSGASGSTSQVTVGRLSFDGVAFVQAGYDQNVAGAIGTNKVRAGVFDVQITGRGTLTFYGSDLPTEVWYFYAIGPNRAFLMNASTAAVAVGSMEPQTSKPPFNNTSVDGFYSSGSGEPMLATTTLYVGTSSFDGNNAVSGIEDISFASSTAADQVLAGKYLISTSANDGRGTVQLTSPSAATIRLWTTSSTEVLGLDIDPSDVEPVLLRYEQ